MLEEARVKRKESHLLVDVDVRGPERAVGVVNERLQSKSVENIANVLWKQFKKAGDRRGLEHGACHFIL